MAGVAPQDMRLDALDIQQLSQLKEKITNDLQQFTQHGQQLALAARKFEESRASVSRLSENKDGHQMLLPLTQSMYVTGTVSATDKVTIDIGTGYFVEMNSDQAQSYCKRKVEKLSESLKSVQQIVKERQLFLGNVEQMLGRKVAAARAAEAASTSA